MINFSYLSKISFALGLQLIWSLNLYAFSPLGVEWDNNRSNPVKYRINIASAPSGFQQAVINAFETWNSIAAANISFSYDGLTNAGYLEDGVNTISWSVSDPFSNPETLAQNRLTPSGGSIVESDILFDGTENYSTDGSSDSIDIETVALHEIGHFLGLGHSTVTPSILLPTYVGTQRSLKQDDIDGIKFIYDSTPPTLQLNDDLNNPINDLTDKDTVVATAQDTARGMFQIVLVQLPSGTTIQSRSFTGETISVSATFSGLSDGQFKIVAVDGRGNDTSKTFTIDRTPPSILEVKDSADSIISHWETTFDQTINVTVSDGNSGLAKIVLEGFTPEGNKTSTVSVSGFGPVTRTFSNLVPASLYRILVYDQAGNKSEHPFYVLVSDSEGTGEHAFNHFVASQTQVNDAGNPVSHIRTGPFYIGPNVSTSSLITISMEAMATSTITAAEVPCKYNISNNNYFDPGVYYTEVATPEGVVDFNTPVLESIGGNMPFTNTAPNTAPERRRTTFTFPVGDLLPVANSTAVPVFSFYYRVKPNITLVPTIFLSSCSLFVPVSIEIDKIDITFPTSPGSSGVVPASTNVVVTSENGIASLLLTAVNRLGNVDFVSGSKDPKFEIVSGGNTLKGSLEEITSNIYDITTTAEYSGNTQVRINYSNAQVSPENEADLKILKLDGGGGPLAEDITVSIDTAKKVITGVISTTESTVGRFGVGLVDITTPTVSVALNPQSSVSSGTVDVTLTASEPLSLSVLGYTISGGTSTNVPLVSVDSITFTGSFTVDQSMNGLAQWTWSGEDLAGNVGTGITAGSTFFVDTIPPSTITDLKVISFSTSSIDLTWTSPQDAGTLGFASSYNLRFSTAKIVTESDFQSAGVITTTNPQSAGSLESLAVTGLAASTSHFFAIRSLDNAGNLSGISNPAFVDPTPPVTEILVSPSSFTANNNVYISSDSFLVLQSTDLADIGHPSGVAEVQYIIDDSTPFLYAAPFNLTGGSHSISFQGIDNFGNVEPLQTSVFLVDQAPPITNVNSSSLFSDGVDLYAQPGHNYTLEAVDPQTAEIIEFSDDFTSDLSQWQTLFGVWLSTSGVLKNSDSGSLKTVRQDFSSDRTVSLKAKTLLEGSDTWHVTWIYPKYEDTNNYILFILHQTGNLELNVMKNAVMDRYDISTGLDPLVEHQYRAVIQGQNIQIFIDDIQYADVTNSNVPQIAGGIAVRGEASLIQADDVEVKRIAPSSASGVRNIFALLDGGSEFVFSSSITINGEGVHTLSFRSDDNVGNIEEEKNQTIRLDATPPQSRLLYGSPRITIGTTTFISPNTSLSVLSIDSEVNEVASGIEDIGVTVDGSSLAILVIPSSYSAITSTFTLSGGEHLLVFSSTDNVRNEEVSRSSMVTVDANAPVILVSSPTNGDRFVALRDTFEVRFDVSDNYDISPSSDAFLSHTSSTNTFPVSDGQIIDPQLLLSGFWTLTVNTTDFVGNSVSVQTSGFEIVRDTLSPLSQLELNGAQFVLAGSTYGTNETQLTIGTTDDLTVTGDRLGLGISETFFAINSSSFIVHSGSFTLSQEGVNTIRFFSEDIAGNIESVQISTFLADNSAPQTTLTIGNPHVVLNSSRIINSKSLMTLLTQDNLSNGVASGVGSLEVSVDGVSFVVNGSTSFALEGGTHTFSYFGSDNVGNSEVSQSTSVTVDVEPPVITATSPLNGSKFVAGSDTFKIDFNVVDNYDPSPSSTAFLTLGSSVIMVTDGLTIDPSSLSAGFWTLTVGATDFVDNAVSSPVANFEVVFDTLAPRSSLQLSGIQFTSNGSLYITTQTAVALSSFDDLVVSGDNLGLGVEEIRFSIDSSTSFAFYSAPFTIGEGSHTVRFFGQDTAGNTELVQSTTLLVDVTPPLTSINVGEPNVISQGTVTISSFTLISLDSIDPVVDGIASGHQLSRYRIDGGSFTIFNDSFTLGGGNHLLEFQSDDNVGNLEVLRSTSLFVDNIAPSAVSDLDVINIESSSVTLTWSAPGGNGTIGQADRYDVRISTFLLDESNFPQAVVFEQNIIPSESGTSESLNVTSLTIGMEYYFAVKSLDSVNNTSLISNVVSTRTFVPDIVPPLVNMVSPVNGSLLGINNPVVIVAQYSDSDSGINLSRVEVVLDGNDVTNQSQVLASSVSFIPASAIPDGIHIAEVTVFDNAGNFVAALSSFTTDITRPTAQITISPQSPVKAGTVELIMILSEQAFDTVSLSYRPEGQSLLPIGLSTTDNTVFTGSLTVDSTMDGTVEFFWSGRDLAGNSGNNQITTGRTFVVDTVSPSASISMSPVSPVTAGAVNVTITSDEFLQSASLSYSIEGGSPISVPVSGGGNTWTGTFNIDPDSENGTAQYNWTGVDLAGNNGNTLSGTTNFEIDTIAPIGNLKINNDANYTTSSIVTVSFQAADFTIGGRVAPTSVLLSLDGGSTYTEETFVESKQVTLPAGGFTLPNEQGVSKRIFAKFKDMAGNESTPVKNGIVLDTSGPPKSVILMRKR